MFIPDRTYKCFNPETLSDTIELDIDESNIPITTAKIKTRIVATVC